MAGTLRGFDLVHILKSRLSMTNDFDKRKLKLIGVMEEYGWTFAREGEIRYNTKRLLKEVLFFDEALMEEMAFLMDIDPEEIKAKLDGKLIGRRLYEEVERMIIDDCCISEICKACGYVRKYKDELRCDRKGLQKALKAYNPNYEADLNFGKVRDELFKARIKRYLDSHPERVNPNPEYIKQYQKDNPEKIKEYHRQYYLRNRERLINKSLEYQGIEREEKVEEKELSHV